MPAGVFIHIIAAKNRAMKRCLIPLLLLVLSCHKPLLPAEGGRRDETDPHASHEEYREPESIKSILISGVEYPQGYDWVLDSGFGSTSAWILMFEGSQEVLRFPAGNGSPWSPDPDGHRIWNGHLYTFATAGNETVIGRDGAEILRYEGAESIRGFAVDGGKILTLGQKEGGGFSLRLDGKAVFFSESGFVQGSLDRGIPRSGALFRDNGHWYFSFIDNGRLHLVQDNAEVDIPEANPPADAVVGDGRTITGRLAFYRHKYRLDLAWYGLFYNWLPSFYERPSALRLIHRDGQFRAVLKAAGEWYVWDAASGRFLEQFPCSSLELYPGKSVDAAVLTTAGKVTAARPCAPPAEGAYAFLSGACAMWDGDEFIAGYSGLDGTPNLVMRDDIGLELNFNGPITSVAVAE